MHPNYGSLGDSQQNPTTSGNAAPTQTDGYKPYISGFLLLMLGVGCIAGGGLLLIPAGDILNNDNNYEYRPNGRRYMNNDANSNLTGLAIALIACMIIGACCMLKGMRKCMTKISEASQNYSPAPTP